MEIHKPRAAHSWREFGVEVATIVLGIVIALAGEQIVQTLDWRAKVSRSEANMRDEMAEDDGPQVLQRLALAPCIDAALARIRSAVENGASRADVLRLVAEVDTPRHTWDSLAYAAANASTSVEHFDPDQLGWWNYTYAAMPALDRVDEREFRDAGALHAINRAGGPLSETERSKMLDAVENLSRDNSEIVKHARQAAEGLRRLGISASADGRRRVTDELRARPGAANCLPALERSASR